MFVLVLGLQVHTTTERGVAGIMAVVLAIHGATYGLIAGVVLYFLIEKTTLFKSNNGVEDEVEEKKAI